MNATSTLLAVLSTVAVCGAVWAGICFECGGMAAGDEGPAFPVPPERADAVMDGGVVAWTDSVYFAVDSVVTIHGYSESPENQVTIVVLNPAGNIAAVSQVESADDGTFEASVSTAGFYWKQEGWYAITARAGPNSEPYTVHIGLGDAGRCGTGQIPVDAGAEGVHCMGAVSGRDGIAAEAAVLNVKTRTLAVRVSGDGPGSITFDVPRHLLDSRDGDGADTPFVVTAGDQPVMFSETDPDEDHRRVVAEYPGTYGFISIRGTHVIPEFGAVAAILAVSVAGVLAARRMSPVHG